MPDRPLADLPSLKDELAETRELLQRLNAKKDEIDSSRYERLASRYQETLDTCKTAIETLTEEGETRKLELENRLAHQQDLVEEAKEELDEVTSLHEAGALDDDTYREDRRRLRRKKRTAEKEASSIDRQLREINFYLTETGDVSYTKSRVRGRVKGIVDGVKQLLPRGMQHVGTLVSESLEGWSMPVSRRAGLIIGATLLGISLAAWFGSSVTVTNGADGSAYRGSIARTGYYDAPGPDLRTGEAPVVRWMFTPPPTSEADEGYDLAFSPISVQDGVAYAGHRDGNLYAVDTNTGQRIWNFQTGDAVFTAPAISGENVYIGSLDGRLYSLNAQSGDKIWEFDTGSRIFASPVVHDGVIYVAGEESGTTYALDTDTGQELWRFETDERIVSTLAYRDGRVYVTSHYRGNDMYKTRVTTIEAASGSEIWTHIIDHRSASLSAPVVDSDHVYISGAYGEMLAISVDTGERAWSFSTEGEIRTSPAVDDTRVYIANEGQKTVHALASDTGEEIWRFDTEAEVSTPISIANGRAYIASQAGRLYALDAESGRWIWEHEIEGNIFWSAPTVANRTIYLADVQGTLYAFSDTDRE
ncbi:hypothetical protein CRI94_16430 [Longibacter salinarum]|uniref:Pyrrolo-quinoline quinone repeat domain-containing protein n=1 Tax=Longibacter salinarum TaxID=1850348 RepID=A0A2A8CTS1_9BACT|nr:PQQ-binding-like beta-propeller repeat protein [Longibacter salinarum]PEN11176.1 hypothetical protein CRI94_16430 [Longibacter salinarum]